MSYLLDPTHYDLWAITAPAGLTNSYHSGGGAIVSTRKGTSPDEWKTVLKQSIPLGKEDYEIEDIKCLQKDYAFDGWTADLIGESDVPVFRVFPDAGCC